MPDVPGYSGSDDHANRVGSHRKWPYLKEIERSKQLMVGGKPFLILGGELQNSSLTSATYMREQWSKLKEANINTILGCVPWEIIEPTEGQFDFTELDQIIQDARSHGLRLILLWFGAFKNGL
jgi:GH35 family endo-1,4-beta-xylanase